MNACLAVWEHEKGYKGNLKVWELKWTGGSSKDDVWGSQTLEVNYKVHRWVF